MNGLPKAVIGMAAYRTCSASKCQHSRNRKRRKYKYTTSLFSRGSRSLDKDSRLSFFKLSQGIFREAVALACASSQKPNATKNPPWCREVPGAQQQIGRILRGRHTSSQHIPPRPCSRKGCPAQQRGVSLLDGLQQPVCAIILNCIAAVNESTPPLSVPTAHCS